MRQARFLALCRRRLLGVILAGELAVTGSGCHQHYHYYGSSACGPSTTALPSTVQSGTTTICDDGTQVVEGGTKVGNGPTISSNVSSSTRSSRVVLSEPPRNAWKTARSDPDSNLATKTDVEGALGDSTIKQ